MNNPNCPNIHGCIEQVIADPCGSGTMADDAMVELVSLEKKIGKLESMLRELWESKLAEDNYRTNYIGPYEGKVTEKVRSVWNEELTKIAKLQCDANEKVRAWYKP